MLIPLEGRYSLHKDELKKEKEHRRPEELFLFQRIFSKVLPELLEFRRKRWQAIGNHFSLERYFRVPKLRGVFKEMGDTQESLVEEVGDWQRDVTALTIDGRPIGFVINIVPSATSQSTESLKVTYKEVENASKQQRHEFVTIEGMSEGVKRTAWLSLTKDMNGNSLASNAVLEYPQEKDAMRLVASFKEDESQESKIQLWRNDIEVRNEFVPNPEFL